MKRSDAVSMTIQEFILFIEEHFDITWEEEEFDTDREVGGIVYKMGQVYHDSVCNEPKKFAIREAYFQRLCGKFARAMKVQGGQFKGQWACYVSYVNKGE